MVSTIALDLDDRTVARLRTVCSARNRQPLELVRQAVAEFLDREEGLAEDAARWHGYDAENATIDNDIGAERLDRLGARGRRTATLVGE